MDPEDAAAAPGGFMSSLRACFVAALFVAAGCETKITSRVGVHAVGVRTSVRNDGPRLAPIQGAAVRVECSGTAGESVGTTDTAGWLLANSATPVDVGCAVSIEH